MPSELQAIKEQTAEDSLAELLIKTHGTTSIDIYSFYHLKKFQRIHAQEQRFNFCGTHPFSFNIHR
jgi:hypothetical protein